MSVAHRLIALVLLMLVWSPRVSACSCALTARNGAQRDRGFLRELQKKVRRVLPTTPHRTLSGTATPG